MSDNFFNAIKNAADKCAEAGWGDSTFNDACFIIEKGATKLPNPTSNKQYEQKFRHLPHHTKGATDGAANNTVDIPHLRNALARVSQVKPIKEDKAGFVSRAQAHLQRHAKALLKSNKAEICAEAQLICREFNISTADILESIPSIQVVKNGPENKPYCVVDQQGKQVECYVTMAQAQDRADKMMNKK